MGKAINCNEIDWKPTNIKGFSYHQLIDETGGTLKYIRIEPNAAYPSHLHPDKTEYAVILEGTCTITLNNEEFIAITGDVVVFPKAVNHALANATNERVVLLVGAIVVDK